MVLGIDVSAYQRSISWKAIKAAGIEFGFVKATEGTGYVNSTYKTHRRGARRNEIPIGAYHFARPDSDDGPLAEADHFLEVAAPREGDLLPVLDFERAGLPPRELARWARAWLRRVEKRIGQPPILYTYSSFWTSLVGNAKGFSRYPLWLANYGKNNGKVHPVRTVGGWPGIAVHQFTSEGRIEGYSGPLDLNRLMKGTTVDQLRLGVEPPPSPGYGPPWLLVARGDVLHEAKRLDAGFLERAVEQAKTGGVATIRGTPREPPPA
jgi:GH25 family lysozyme M1 (1,4-beta-N-acetylmuramidase)